MPRLVPLNAATCPHCRKKETDRVGYSESRKRSLWRCRAEGCGKVFDVPLLVLTPRRA